MMLSGNGAKSFSVFRRLLLYSTSSSTSTSISTHSYSDYLVDSLGFSKQQSLSLSAKLTRLRAKVCDFGDIKKSDSVITFLNLNGFDQSHIRQIVSYHPQILQSQIDKTLKPKIDFLRNYGLSGSDLVQFVSKYPVVVTLCLNSCILPAVEALKKVLGDDETTIAAVKRLNHSSFAGVAKNLAPNVVLLQSYGISLQLIRKHIVEKPGVYVRDTKLFRDMLVRVDEKWGITPASSMFFYGINLLMGFKEERIDSKVGVFKTFGWTESDVQTIMKKNPNCFRASETRIKKTLEFLMNELGYKPDVIASRSSLLICSLEKRIIPRHKMLVFLKEKGMVRKEEYPLHNVIILGDAAFFRRFVLPYKEVYELYAETSGRSVELLTKGQADIHSQSCF